MEIPLSLGLCEIAQLVARQPKPGVNLVRDSLEIQHAGPVSHGKNRFCYPTINGLPATRTDADLWVLHEDTSGDQHSSLVTVHPIKPRKPPEEILFGFSCPGS